jgi:hypothetical protein
MWQSVVLLAITDSLLPASTPRDTHRLAVTEARNWLSTDSRDLRLVLEHAGLDPGWFLTRALPVLVERWQVADAGPVQPRRRSPAREARSDDGAGRQRQHADLGLRGPPAAVDRLVQLFDDQRPPAAI